MEKKVQHLPLKVNVKQKFSLFHDYWNPRILGALNGQEVKVVKFQGEFVWHSHENEDELFFVIRGKFRMEFRQGSVELSEGEFLIVPKGVEHRPVADDEVEVMLFEPAGTINTGEVQSEKRRERLERI
ncbi:MAG: cupin domain-containing protein [Chloroherpetonaceae bacterium]|nr:cupin domain-containing protein [Chloroherpetonaceae bacterium]